MLDFYTISQRLLLHEGLRLKPYYCSKGKQTIGIGRCLDTNPLSPEESKVVGDWQHGITKGAVMYLLRNDVKRINRELKKQVDFFADLDSERQYALIDMAFNLGVNGLLKFKKMLKALCRGNYEQAAAECLNSSYAHTVGIRAKRIAELIRTGQFKINI